MMRLLKGARLVCPATGLDEVGDLLVEGGKISAIGGEIDAGEAEVVDCTGKVLAPALVELHAHIGEPGQTWREGFESGGAAAAAGGFTHVVIEPSTAPVLDDATLLAQVLDEGRRRSVVEIAAAGAFTVGLKGENVAEVGLLSRAGASVLSNGDNIVENTSILRNSLLYSKGFGLPVFLRAGEGSLESRGAMHEGSISLRIGIRGLPSSAEEMGVGRIIALVRDTRVAVHITGVSSSVALERILEAREEGLPITASTPAHNLLLTDEAVLTSGFNTFTRLLPPLRGESDREALVAAVKAGWLMVSSAHTPWSRVEKEFEFELSVPGAVGLETAFATTLTATGDVVAAVRALSAGPAALLGLERSLEVGRDAELVLFDPEERWQVDPNEFISKGRNTPLAGENL